jgi:hypothetical protein
MSYIPDVSRTATLSGGILAATAVVFAESVSTDPTVGAGSVLLGSAGLIAAISAFTKDFWLDRQRQREYELARLRFRARAHRSAQAVEALLDWARAAREAAPALPPAPELGPKVDNDHDA